MKKDSLLRVLINVLGFPYGVNYDDITYVITFGKRYGYCED